MAFAGYSSYYPPHHAAVGYSAPPYSHPLHSFSYAMPYSLPPSSSSYPAQPPTSWAPFHPPPPQQSQQFRGYPSAAHEESSLESRPRMRSLPPAPAPAAHMAYLQTATTPVPSVFPPSHSTKSFSSTPSGAHPYPELLPQIDPSSHYSANPWPQSSMAPSARPASTLSADQIWPAVTPPQDQRRARKLSAPVTISANSTQWRNEPVAKQLTFAASTDFRPSPPPPPDYAQLRGENEELKLEIARLRLDVDALQSQMTTLHSRSFDPGTPMETFDSVSPSRSGGAKLTGVHH